MKLLSFCSIGGGTIFPFFLWEGGDICSVIGKDVHSKFCFNYIHRITSMYVHAFATLVC